MSRFGLWITITGERSKNLHTISRARLPRYIFLRTAEGLRGFLELFRRRTEILAVPRHFVTQAVIDVVERQPKVSCQEGVTLIDLNGIKMTQMTQTKLKVHRTAKLSEKVN